MRNALLGACLAFSSPRLQRRRRRSGPYRARFAIRRTRWFPASRLPSATRPPGVERHLTSGSDGTFSAPALAAGEYTVTAELSGFRTLQRAVTVATGRVLTVDLHMEIGQATEVVNVAAAAVHVDVETHAISGLITRQKIQELPHQRPQLPPARLPRTWRLGEPRLDVSVQLALFGVDSRRRLQQDGHHG